MPSTDPPAAGSIADGSVDERRGGAEPIDAVSSAFPRDARLLSGRDYDAVFGDNHRLADRYWTVLVHRRGERPDAPDGHRPSGARLGLAVAKKRARRAVDRNRIKRVARESFRRVRSSLAGRDVVVMNRDAAAGASAADLRAALDALWSKATRPATGPGRKRGGRRPADTGSSRQGARGGRASGAPSSGTGPRAAIRPATGAPGRTPAGSGAHPR